MEDQIAIKWHIMDVQDHIEEVRNVELSDEEAREILCYIERKHDASIGINWLVIEDAYDWIIKK